MGCLKFLFKLFKKNIFKNFIIAIQISLSVFACTFFIIPIVKSIDTNNLVNNMNLEENIAFFSESTHVQLSSENYTFDKYEKLKEYMNNIDGIESIGSVYSLLAINEQLNVIMYDQEVCDTIKLSLSEGEWFTKDLNSNNEVPVIITRKLKNKYQLNSTFELSLDAQDGIEKELKITCKVIGILKDGAYIYSGGSSHSDPSISDLFTKTSNNDEIIILPNQFKEKPRYWAFRGMLVKYEDFQKASNKIKESGIGEINKVDFLKNNEVDNVLIYNEQKIYEFIIIFIFILISISGYNTLANLEYRRLLTIYFINGITWKKGITLLTIRNLILIIVPTILASIISNIIVCNVKTIYTFDVKNIVITSIIYLLIFIITTLITIISLRKQRPIEILKEVD